MGYPTYQQCGLLVCSKETNQHIIQLKNCSNLMIKELYIKEPYFNEKYQFVEYSLMDSHSLCPCFSFSRKVESRVYRRITHTGYTIVIDVIQTTFWYLLKPHCFVILTFVCIFNDEAQNTNSRSSNVTMNTICSKRNASEKS